MWCFLVGPRKCKKVWLNQMGYIIYETFESCLFITFANPDWSLYHIIFTQQVFMSNIDNLYSKYDEYDVIVPTFKSSQISFWKSALNLSLFCDFLVGLWELPVTSWAGYGWSEKTEVLHETRLQKSDMEVRSSPGSFEPTLCSATFYFVHQLTIIGVFEQLVPNKNAWGSVEAIW